VKEGGDHI